MRVLLVNAVSYYVKQKAAVPLGLLSLATVLKQNGHTVEVFDRSVCSGSAARRISRFKPDMVGISSLGIKSFPDGMKVSKAAKSRGIPVVWGGHIPSLIPDLVLGSGLVDYVAVGDGEPVLTALLDALAGKTSLRGIAGLAWLDNGAVTVNPPAEPRSLAEYPVIDFGFVRPQDYFVRNPPCRRMLHVYSSRGCTGRCAYCYSPAHCSGRWRPRPVGCVIAELKNLKDNFGIDGFYFVDDLFAPGAARVREVCAALAASGLDLLWSCDMRTDLCDEALLREMYAAGCRWIFFGVESGSPERQQSVGKHLDIPAIEEVLRLCRSIGIWTTASFVIGFPGEDERELKQTLAFVDKLSADVKLAALYGPMPGSEMTEQLVASGRLERPAGWRGWRDLAVIDTLGEGFSKVPSRELKVIANYFFLSIFLAKKESAGRRASRVWVKRVAAIGADIARRGGWRNILLLLLSVWEFTQIVWYALMFPGIRKKYGLRFFAKNQA